MRSLLRKPQFWLAIGLALLVSAGVDTYRAPADQVTARFYVRLVRGYQYVTRPQLDKYVCCRYQPSCSEYSIQAVERHGILMGLGLTISRVCRCTGGVAPSTQDPVPEGPIR